MTDWTSIGANVGIMIGAVTGTATWIYHVLVKPSRKALVEANNKLAELERQQVYARLKKHGEQIDQLEKKQNDLMTRDDFMEASKDRTRQIDTINDKIDELVEGRGKTNESLRHIEKSVDTMYQLWNKEHERK
jgi:hypothetical protein